MLSFVYQVQLAALHNNRRPHLGQRVGARQTQPSLYLEHQPQYNKHLTPIPPTHPRPAIAGPSTSSRSYHPFLDCSCSSPRGSHNSPRVYAVTSHRDTFAFSRLLTRLHAGANQPNYAIIRIHQNTKRPWPLLRLPIAYTSLFNLLPGTLHIILESPAALI